MDGLFLEVIAKREIAQHLEEGVVARGRANAGQVVVLARDAHTFLGGDGAGVRPFFLPQKHLGKLVHARVVEQQGGVVFLWQGGAGHFFVSHAPKIINKGTADLVATHVSLSVFQSVSLSVAQLASYWLID